MAACNQIPPFQSQLLNNMRKRKQRLQQLYGKHKVKSALGKLAYTARVNPVLIALSNQEVF